MHLAIFLSLRQPTHFSDEPKKKVEATNEAAKAQATADKTKVEAQSEADKAAAGANVDKAKKQ